MAGGLATQQCLRRTEKTTPGSLSPGWKLRDSHLSYLCITRAVEAWSFESAFVIFS